MRMMHIADRDGKDTTVRFVPLRPLPNPERAVSGRPVRMARFMVATDDTTHQHLMTQHGTDYGAALVESDPEIDLETLGRPVGSTNTVFVNQHGEPLRVIPEMVELVLDPSGNERERREPINLSANIQEEEPIRLSKVRIKRAEAIRRFAFPRRITLTHVDGLTYQFLFDLAADLDQADEMAMVGAGPKGRDPLVFQEGGQPWRGFLAGRVTDNRYSLVLHLSNLELRTPEEVAHGA